MTGEGPDEEGAVGSPAGANPLRSLSLGFLAMTPMLLAYELGLAASGGTRHNLGEALLSLGLRPLGSVGTSLRWVILIALALAAWQRVRSRGQRVRPAAARVILEGIVFAAVLGPLLVLLMAAFGDLLPHFDPSWDPQLPPGLAPGALLFGGAAWEELCFRVGLYSLLFVFARRCAVVLGLRPDLAGWLGEGAGFVGSSLFFALMHFAPFSRRIGRGGFEFEPATFTWLFLAGMLLALLFRLRGPGVAAWSHGLFNLALWIGVEPDVVL